MGAITKNSEKELITRMGKLGKQWGLGEPAGRIFASLLLAETPLTQKEVAIKTGYSLSLISPNLKLLEKLNLVQFSKGDDRENRYKSIGSFTESFGKILRMFLENDVRPIIDSLENSSRNKKDRFIDEYRQLERNLHIFETLCLNNGVATASTWKKN